MPFADTCSALTAADFKPLGLTLTKADHGLSDVPEICFYQVKAADGTTAQPSVEFVADNMFDATRALFNKAQYKFKDVSGVGDRAFTYTTLSPVLWVIAKGHLFHVDSTGLGAGVGTGNPEADIETLAKAVVAKL